MRKSLMTRFLICYLILFLCTPVLADSLFYTASFEEKLASAYNVSVSPAGFLLGYFQYAGQRLSTAILPGINAPSLFGLVVTVALALAGAALFARGILKQYDKLCARVDSACEGNPVPSSEPGGVFRELGRKLDALLQKRAQADAADAKRMEDCKAARDLLEAARAQAEVLLEAEVLPGGGAEVALLKEVVSKIQKAEGLVVGQD